MVATTGEHDERGATWYPTVLGAIRVRHEILWFSELDAKVKMVLRYFPTIGTR